MKTFCQRKPPSRQLVKHRLWTRRQTIQFESNSYTFIGFELHGLLCSSMTSTTTEQAEPHFSALIYRLKVANFHRKLV